MMIEAKQKVENLEQKIESLKTLMNSENLGFTKQEEWETLVDHVEVHKYLINEEMDGTITWEQAAFSWKENVYTPLKNVIDWWEVKKAFSGYSKGQLLFAVSTHWYYMKEKDPGILPEDAANDFAAFYGKGIGSWISRRKIESAMAFV